MTTRKALELARETILELTGWDWVPEGQCIEGKKAIDAIDAALAQPDPQPVAWMMTADQYRRPAEFYREKPPFVPPICDLVPLYAAPVAPAREISDEQIVALAEEVLNHRLQDEPRLISFARAVLAASKEQAK